MHHLCPSCDKESKLLSDFAECRNRNHDEPLTIYDEGDQKPKKKNSDSSNQRQTIKKVKGHVGQFFVESILVDNKPTFLCYNFDNNRCLIKDSLSIEGIVFVPIDDSDCGYIPYRYTEAEIQELLGTKLDKQQILGEILEQISLFLVLEDYNKCLVLGDILLSYFQDKINTTHYLFFVGENESGKSSGLHLFRWLGYRCLYGEDIPLADVYNFLGTDEEGAGMIAEDEAQEIGSNKEKIRTYKNSYAKGSVKARIIMTNSKKIQVFYKTFCLKVFAGERTPEDKGMKERLVIVKMLEGFPEANIKRSTVEQRSILNRLRNKLLVYKIQNIKDDLPKVDYVLKQRDQELWEDFLAIVHGSQYYEKCVETVKYYTEQRHDTIKNSLEARIFRILLDQLDVELKLRLEQFWLYLVQEQDELLGIVEKDTFYPHDFFAVRVTRNLLSKLFQEKFQAKKISTYEIDEHGKPHKNTLYVFDNQVIQTLSKKYHLEKRPR